MRKIIKGDAPKSLEKWVNKHGNTNYEDLPPDIRQEIREACTKEQFYICAYCCQDIDGTNETTVNEHIIPRDKEPNKSLDFSNIVASCNRKDQCDSSHKNEILPLTPLMGECEIELEYHLNGCVEGKTERANELIKILNLGSEKLIYRRKQAIDTMIYGVGETPESIRMLDFESFQIIIDDMKKVDDEGHLLPYSPVVVNFLENLKKAL